MTRAFLARVEDLLGQTAEHSRNERHSGDAEVENAILDLRIKSADSVATWKTALAW